MKRPSSAVFSLIVGPLLLGACVDGSASEPDAGSGGTLGQGGAFGAGTGPGLGARPQASGGEGSGATPGSGGSNPAGGAAAASGGSVSSSGSGGCVDTCPAPKGGITIDCKKRFLYGVNYAWSKFGTDFGGLAAWSQQGVAANPDPRRTALEDMRDHGVDVVRWWMFPALRADGLTFEDGIPNGLGATTAADIEAALALADEVGIHLQLTLFSFDNFKATATTNGATAYGMKPVITNDANRASLMNVVRQIAQVVAQSPHTSRMISWDIINEPEWAISGSDPYGDPDFTPNANLESVTFSQMEGFVKETIAVLREESTAQVTVGGAAVKWAKAWTQVDIDFYTVHLYDWVNMYFPYTRSPAAFGLTDKPVVLGEFPLAGLTGVPYAALLDTLYDVGYAGAMAWSVTDRNFNWSSNKANVKAWADAHACVTRF